MTKLENSKCPLCTGNIVKGTTTFTAELGEGVIVIRHVPADICEQCGANWFDDQTAAKIEKIVSDSRKSQTTVAVLDFAA